MKTIQLTEDEIKTLNEKFIQRAEKEISNETV